MNEFCETLVNGTLSGLAAAAVWALLVWCYQWRKDNSISKAIHQSIANTKNIVVSVDGIGFTLKNETRWPFTVRHVAICTPQGRAVLRYNGKIEYEYHPDHILLKPRMEGTWVTRVFEHFDNLKKAPVGHIEVTIEYTRLFGEVAVTAVKTSSEHAQMVESLKQQIKK